jgi:catechol-2,3-dioxygenase
MATTGLSHFNLHAKRELLDELKEFYCSVVGLQVGPRPPLRNFGYWLYASDKAIVHLYQTDPDEERSTSVATTFDHIAFDCTHRSEVEAMLVRRGLTYRSTLVPDSKQVQFFLQDPAGNGVELNFSSADA